MSISYKDSNLKIWNFINWTCLINIPNKYSSGYLYSACFLNKQNNYYFVTSNFEESKFADSIKVYDYDKKIYKIINGSEFNVSFIKVFYTNEETYIISCNEENIKSYNYNQNKLFLKYQDLSSYLKIISFCVYTGKTIKLFGSCHDSTIRIWDFFTGSIISKVKIHTYTLKSLCIVKERNFLIGCDKNEIQFLDLKGFNKVKTLNQSNENIFYIKKRYLSRLGSLIVSQGNDNHIEIWQLKECS